MCSLSKGYISSQVIHWSKTVVSPKFHAASPFNFNNVLQTLCNEVNLMFYSSFLWCGVTYFLKKYAQHNTNKYFLFLAHLIQCSTDGKKQFDHFKTTKQRTQKQITPILFHWASWKLVKSPIQRGYTLWISWMVENLMVEC